MEIFKPVASCSRPKDFFAGLTRLDSLKQKLIIIQCWGVSITRQTKSSYTKRIWVMMKQCSVLLIARAAAAATTAEVSVPVYALQLA